MSQLTIGSRALRIEDVVAVAHGELDVLLHDAPAFVSRIERGAAIVARRVAQDEVSMGSIAAQDFLQIVSLTENVLAVHLIASAQAVELRGVGKVSPRVAELHRLVRAQVEPTLRDRPMDGDIIAACALVRTGAL